MDTTATTSNLQNKIAKTIGEYKKEEAFKNMWNDLNSTMNKLLKAKIGPYEREQFLNHLPFIIKGFYLDGHADKAQILEKKLAKYARNLRLPLEPLLDTSDTQETQGEPEENVEEIIANAPVDDSDNNVVDPTE